MIHAEFLRGDNGLLGFCVSGHAGYADYGEDIVCAAVTSAIQLTANGITEVVNAPCELRAEQNEIMLKLSDDSNKIAVDFLSALEIHLSVLAESYPDNICLEFSEV